MSVIKQFVRPFLCWQIRKISHYVALHTILILLIWQDFVQQHVRNTSKGDIRPDDSRSVGWIRENYRFEFSIISNDFWSSKIWAIHIQIAFPGVEIAKNPGIQPTDQVSKIWSTRSSAGAEMIIFRNFRKWKFVLVMAMNFKDQGLFSNFAFNNFYWFNFVRFLSLSPLR